ncbi:sugar ABC transporter permease [Clostridiales bacterium COT073_COT-073]|nr:sugar ABC transporter permease [Clostridiales bacterium COT073_COT-073]
MLKSLKKDRVLYLMLLPTLLFFLVFHVIPILGMRLAFYDYRIKGDNIFVGLKHFEKLFSTPVFFQILKNTLIISAMKIFLFFPLPIMLAIMLNEFRSGPFRKGVQIVSYLPHFLSWVVIAGIWIEFLSPTTGVVNLFLNQLGMESIDFLTDKSTIRWVLLASESWRSIGWDSIIYFAAILGIDATLYEAAKIDGASRGAVIRHIILPELVVTMVTVLILNIGFFMNAGLDQVLNFTNAAVNSRIDIIDTYVYRVGLGSSQYSFATAANLFKGLVGTTLIVSTHLLSRRLTGKGAW